MYKIDYWKKLFWIKSWYENRLYRCFKKRKKTEEISCIANNKMINCTNESSFDEISPQQAAKDIIFYKWRYYLFKDELCYK